MRKLLSLVICCLLFSLFPSLSNTKVYTLGTATYTPPKPSHQYMDWDITDTNIQKWWRKGYTGKNVKIGIIDTGIDGKHPDLTGAIAGGVSFIKGEPYNVDYEGHGTHVAGLIAAQNNNIGSVGIAYGSKIYAIKVISKNGVGNVSDVIKGINWCIANKMDIINMSIGLTPDETAKPEFKVLENIINKAYAKGILIVASSGNDGINKVSYPANFKNVIAVGGAYEEYNDKTKKTSIGWADFSNYSSKIEVIAPSTFLYSTYPMQLTPGLNDYKGYESMTGTSMASPLVVGFLAVLKQRYPKYSVQKLRYLLHINTIPVSPKGQTGYGFIYAKY